METLSIAGYKKNRGLIILIAVAGMTAYLLPYFKYYYYDAFLVYFDINDMQMGVLGSVYGAFAIIGYCLGGWVADRFSLKIVVPGSLIVTGILGFVNLLRPSYYVLIVIYAVWGISTILTFWNPLMKALRALCNADEQARGYALFDMGRGILNFLSGIAIVAAFTAVCNKVGDVAGMNALIIFYSAWTILVGVVVYFAFKKMPDFRPQGKEKDKDFAKNVISVIKMPTTWCLIIAMFASYGVICSYFYVVPYCTAAFGMSAALASIMGYSAHITIAGKEKEPCCCKYDIVGSLCENNDKFAVDRMLPKIEIGDYFIIHDTGAHGFSMGYNYNGKLRSAEILKKASGGFQIIRRAERPEDYFATFDELPIYENLKAECEK